MFLIRKSRNLLNFLLLKVSCLLLLLFSGSSFGLIITSNNILDINKYVNDDTLVVFDLDNTLIQNSQTIGSDQWFHSYIDKLKAQGYNDANSLAKAVQLYFKIQNKSKAKLVDPIASTLVKELQSKSPNIMALTSRSFELKDVTISQLASVDINFNRGIAKHKYFSLSPPYNSARVYHGIGFTDEQDKGKCLEDILERENLHPARIVFIDDKEHNVVSIDKMAKRNKIDYIGIRYSYLDNDVENVDLEVANLQEELLDKIISDEEARLLIAYRKQSS